MYSTAIAAMKSAIILAITAEPVFPNIRYILSVSLRTTQLRDITIAMAISAVGIPDDWIEIIVVVIALGPTSSGNAIGKTAVSSMEEIAFLSIRCAMNIISLSNTNRLNLPA